MIRSLIDKYKDWKVQQKQLRLIAWENERKQSKTKHIIKQGLKFAIFMILFSLFLELARERSLKVSFSVITVVVYSLAGLLIGYVSWLHREKEYLVNKNDSKSLIS